MTIGSAISVALGGLQLNQTETGIVAQNIARADQAGYTAKRVSAVDREGLQGVFGIKAVISRQFDRTIYGQALQAAAPTSYLTTQNKYLSQLDQLMGKTTDGASIPSAISAFDQALQSLVTTPDDVSSRTALINKAQALASQLNQASSDIQGLRSSIESEISDQVSTVNGLTKQIADLNGRIVDLKAGGQDVTNLQDQRDLAVKQLASYVDVGTLEQPDGLLQVFTTSGVSLVTQQGTQLSFDAHGMLTAQSQWTSDDSTRTVGTIRVAGNGTSTVDLIGNGSLRSGSLSALVKLRDETLVQAQSQLDDIAAGLAEAMSNHTVDGASATSGAATGYDLDLTGLQSGNRVTLSYTDNATGKPKTVTFVRVDDPATLPLSNDATGNPNDTVFGIDFSGGMASVATQIQSALGGSFSVSNPSGNTLEILNDGAANTVSVTGLSASVTSTSLQDGETTLPLFTDGNSTSVYTGSFDGRSQKLGFAARIGVNTAIAADPALLVKWQTSPATDAADPARPKALLDRLENVGVDFGAETGMSAQGYGFSATVGDFADRMVSFWGSAASSASSALDSQTTIQTNLEQRLKDTSGVNVDQELARLIQLQAAYSANARVMSTAKDMLDALMQI